MSKIFRTIAVIGLLVLIISPFDLNPLTDFTPIIGWLDDAAYALGAFIMIRNGLAERRIARA